MLTFFVNSLAGFGTVGAFCSRQELVLIILWPMEQIRRKCTPVPLSKCPRAATTWSSEVFSLRYLAVKAEKCICSYSQPSSTIIAVPTRL